MVMGGECKINIKLSSLVCHLQFSQQKLYHFRGSAVTKPFLILYYGIIYYIKCTEQNEKIINIFGIILHNTVTPVIGQTGIPVVIIIVTL